MKRGIVLILITLMLLPMATATISITGPSKTQYNIGDSLDVSGHILEEENLVGYLQFSVVCNDESHPLQLTSIDVAAGEQVDFSQLSLPTMTLTQSMIGLCRLQADILVTGVSVEEDTSVSFEVTKDLDGTFDVDKSQIQLGDTIAFTGTVFQVDGDEVEGTAEVYFETEGIEYLVGFLEINEGKINHQHTFLSGFAGEYTANVVVRDSYGNEQEFNGVADFTVIDGLHVFVDTNAEAIFPGEHVNLFGDVTTLTDDPVTTGSIEIGLADEVHSTSLADSQYTYDLWAPTDITSGQHIIRVSARDGHGNTGSGTINLDIKPIGTDIDLKLTNTTFNPGDEFEVEIVLYDQAGDLMADDITFMLYDAQGNKISEKEVYSGEVLKFQLSAFAVPGEWKIKTNHIDTRGGKVGAEAQVKFIVNEISALDYYIEGEVLYVKNVGNTKYVEDFSIAIQGDEEEYVLERSKNLNVNETLAIDLSKEVPTGQYSVIPTGLVVGEVGQVLVADGKPRTGMNWFYSILAIVFLVGLAYIIYWRVGPENKEKKKKGDEEKKEEYKTITVKKKVKKKKLVNKEEEKKKISNTFDDKNKSIEDFKKRTLEEIKKTENKIKQRENQGKLRSGTLGYVTGRKDPDVRITPPPPKKEEKKNPPSAFSIFD
jgi:hypothetical protein